MLRGNKKLVPPTRFEHAQFSFKILDLNVMLRGDKELFPTYPCSRMRSSTSACLLYTACASILQPPALKERMNIRRFTENTRMLF